ncbi:hypothetical protein [Acetobacter orientalis]|uniref:hypothetical protein n=1 Tax=Acetobacter orientalis TaxID=146474 RepID=UPI0039EC45A6
MKGDIRALEGIVYFKKRVQFFTHSYWKSLFLCLGLAFFVRILVALLIPGVWRADEFFQYLEPAHRLSYGTGIITWEWRVGIRSWLVPGILAQLMTIGQVLGIKSQLFFIRLCLSLASLCVVAAFFWYGWRKAGSVGAWTLGLFGIFWPDILSASIRSLGEFLGGNALLVGVILLLAYRREPAGKKGLLIASMAGLALGVAAAIRFQLAPGAGLAMLFFIQKKKNKEILSAYCAFILPIVFLGILDRVTLGNAFQSIFKNYYYNKTLGIADQYGKKWPGFYIEKYIEFWGALCVPAFFFILKAKQEKVIPLLIAGFILFYHSLISHKEMSFVYASVILIVFVAACGCFEVIQKVPEQKAKILGGITVGMLFTFISTYIPFLNDNSIGLRFQKMASKQPDACGIALLTGTAGYSSFEMGGYSTLSKKIPLYLYTSINEATENSQYYNYIITTEQGSVPIFSKEWQQIKCKSNKICLYHHVNQTCAGHPDFEQFSNKLKALEK